MSGIFLLYGVIAVASTVFIYFMLPETKGKSLQEIDRELSEKRFSTWILFLHLIFITMCVFHQF